MDSVKKNVLVIVPCRKKDLKEYEALSDRYSFVFTEQPSTEQLRAAEIIIGEPDAGQLDMASSLKWLQITWAGADDYTSSPSFPVGVALTNASGAFGQAISEYVLSMVLMIIKKLHLYRDNQNKRLLRDCGEESSLCGKTVLIVGAGDVGCRVAKLTKLFQCRNIGIRRVPRKTPEDFDSMNSLEDLDTLLPEADIVVLTLPGTPETNRVIDAGRLGMMKSGAILINVGRGSLVDTDALAAALKNKTIGAAAVDVTDPEPLPENHKLWDCENVIITPHITGACFGHLPQTWDNITNIVIDNLKQYAEGAPLNNLVDFKSGYRVTQNQ